MLLHINKCTQQLILAFPVSFHSPVFLRDPTTWLWTVAKCFITRFHIWNIFRCVTFDVWLTGCFLILLHLSECWVVDRVEKIVRFVLGFFSFHYQILKQQRMNRIFAYPSHCRCYALCCDLVFITERCWCISFICMVYYFSTLHFIKDLRVGV